MNPKEEPAVKENATPSPAPEAEAKKDNYTLHYKGCSVITTAFLRGAATSYENKTGKKIEVTGGGATLGIRAIAAGDGDIGGSCRPPLPELYDEEKGAYMTQIGWGALVFITHNSTPVDNITLEQAKDMLLGKITNWKEVGGPDKEIIAVFRSQVPESGGKLSGVEYMTRLMLFDDTNIDFTEKAIFFEDSAKVEETIEKIEYSFGVSDVSSAKKRNVKMLNLNGIAPAKENIANSKYPLFRPLYLMTKGKPSGEAKIFIDWLLSEEGQKVVSEQGTVSLAEGKDLKEKFRYWKHTELITNY